MRNPKIVLGNLVNKTKEPNYTFERLYKNLYNVNFYLMAYDKLYANQGNMTEGTDGKTVDSMSLERIEQLIESLRDESYKPKPARRVYIPKANGGKRPLGIPSFDDKLVQEVVRNMLESIYEGKFSDRSHGFRPNRSCHSALIQIKKSFGQVKWFVEGDIKGFFDNIDHHVLINILRKHIRDEKFIRLIWKFLRAGYMEDWNFNNTYSGTPQGGIISPILSNIYLNELDKYMEEYKTKFDKGKRRTRNKEYDKLNATHYYRRKLLRQDWHLLNDYRKQCLMEEVKELENKFRSMNSTLPMDENFKRLQYVRYADDFIIGIIGSKEDSEKVKQDLAVFLKSKLGLELSQEKTLVTHHHEFARFLGYDITTVKSERKVTYGDGHKQRKKDEIALYVPKDKWVKKLINLDVIDKNSMDGKSEWKAKHRATLLNSDDLEILSLYNSELRGMYNYYRLANNVSVLNKFHWIMERSLIKTLASKHKTTGRKIFEKHSFEGRFGIKYKTKKEEKIMFLNPKSYTKNDNISKNHESTDVLPKTEARRLGRTSLIARLLANKCEWCGTENVPLEIHHVRKLKDLKGKKLWEKRMIERQRKTLALCARGHGKDCHMKLHAGKLD
jgi:group II intron reverse transcriptase/maturase